MTTSLPLTYLEAGEAVGGVPLLVVHGLFGSARNWAGLAKRFAERRRVYALDLRNHGSAPWAAEMTYDAMAADLLRFLDDRGFARAAVLGHSMGGKAAMTLALQHPDRVERLIAVDIAPVAYGRTFAPYVTALKAARLDGTTRRSDVEAQIAPAIPEAPIRSFLMQNLVSENGAFRWRLNLEALESGMPAIVGFPDPGSRRYEGPALFIGGERSDYVAPEHHAAIAALFPAARIAMVPGAGHWVHAENPDAVAALVEGFL